MKKIKSIMLAGLIAISSFACITTASAASTSGDNTANFYITDSIEGDSIISSSEPSFTANVGDIVEISVSAKATSDIIDFCAIDIRTFFNQSSSDSHNTYDGNGILTYTKGYDDDSFYKLYDGFKNASVITNPDDEHYPSTHNSFIYTLSSARDSGDFSSSQVLYSFTLEVTKPGDSYVNTIIRDIAHDYPGEHLKSEPYLLSTYTTMSVIKQVETPTTDPTDPQSVAGDINGDGSVTLSDALAAQKAALSMIELSKSQIKRADMNGDGRITIYDAVIMQKVSLGMI